MPDNVLENLNQEQIKAVTHKNGPLLIIAGAGTGKTTVITRRIAWLIEQKLALPNEILALTFTDKAARQMQERVDMLVPYGYTDIWISTFHALGDKILREYSTELGLSPDFQVLTRPEAVVFFREHLFEFNLKFYRPLSDPTRFIEALLDLFSRAKDENISIDDYVYFVERLKQAQSQDREVLEKISSQEEIAACYKKYQELLLKESKLDFANQFYLALELLRKRPLVLKKYQEQFKYILVDEFQDTNLSQFELIKLLAGKSKNITTVSDDDQCIYRWRGAAYSNMFNFIEEYKDAQKISLVQNYRSSQKILDAAYKLIQNNNPERFEVKSNIDKRLVSLVDKEGNPPVHMQFDNISSEADYVAKTIKGWVKEKKYEYNDCAILVRSNASADNYIRALNMQDIPWRFSGNFGLYQKEEIRLCINFLRVMADIDDSLSLYYLATSSIYQLPIKILSSCMHYAKRQNRSLFYVLENLGIIEELNSVIENEKRDKISYFTSDINKFLKRSIEITTGRLLYSFLDETKYLKTLVKTQSLENEVKIQNLAKFFEFVQNFENIAKEDRVLYFVQYLDLLIEAGSDPETAEADLDIQAVNIFTIHKAKGLEFDAVFLVDLVQGKFPVIKRKNTLELPEELIKDVQTKGEFHLQEERRLFYVGMTRAKKELYFTSSFDCGGKSVRKISPFIYEALEIKDEPKAKKSTSIDMIERFKEPQKIILKKTRIKDDKVLDLSYYKIDDYSTCPLKYKYVHILHIPIMQHHAVIYGKALHDAVQKYYSYKLMGENLSREELLNTFESLFESEGFISKEHYEERLKTGKLAIERFFNDEKTSQKLPAFIEKPFSFALGNNRISGRWDRLDLEGDDAVIVDFKSSEVKTQKDADKKARESLQLVIYSLAYKNIFGKLPKRVELHFLEPGLIGSDIKTGEDIDEAKEKINEVAIKIREGDFEANPTFMACKYCAYNQICPSVK
ncbi:MAG: UvrD-helicase domain-containing protein [Candidatus Omnitrophota bacterium]